MSSKENLLWSSVRIVVSETTRKTQPDGSTCTRILEIYDKVLREFPARLQKAIEDGRERVVIIAYTDSFGQRAADKLIKLFSNKGIRITSASGLASDGWSAETEVYANVSDLRAVANQSGREL